MRFYRNDDMTSPDQWAVTQDDANRLFGRNRWSLVEVPTDKAGLLGFLANQAQEALWPPALAPDLAPPALPAAPDYATGTIALDEAWEALPLARKLHFAALALEDARQLLKP